MTSFLPCLLCYIMRDMLNDKCLVGSSRFPDICSLFEPELVNVFVKLCVNPRAYSTVIVAV